MRLFYLGLFCAFALPIKADEIWLGATTTLRDSGFLDYILPEFEALTGDEVVVLAQSTGQILQTARDGNLDLVFTHFEEFERAFIAEGFGANRFPIMASSYVLIGPKNDPAKLFGLDIDEAFLRINSEAQIFITRGDESGTAMKEAQIWSRNGITIPEFAIETGQGMGASLNIAATLDAYIFAENSSFLQFQNKRNLTKLVVDGEGLENFYAFTTMNVTRFPKRNHEGANQLVEFFQSEKAKRLIEAFKIGDDTPFTAFEEQVNIE